MICAGDVGGTKTLLGLFKLERDKLRKVREASFDSQAYPSLGAIVGEFLAAGRQRVNRLAVGVAGPVVDGRSQVVNLRWPVDSKKLASELDLDQVQVINDVEATAWGIPELPSRKLLSLTPGLRARPATAALIAPGTGLGMALLTWDGERHMAVPSEGGHQDFAPRDDLEIALLRFLRRRHGRVSAERVVAGPAFSSIYQFLTENGWGKESDWMSRRLAESDDPNAVISRAGISGEDPVAVKAVDMFVSILGSVAGDLALITRATGGVHIGGGIAPKILPKLKSSGFLQSFRNKGRLTPLLEKIAVKVILEPRTALIGAAALAARGPAPQKAKPVRRRAKSK